MKLGYERARKRPETTNKLFGGLEEIKIEEKTQT
jgi:hypothetical protein